MRRGEDVCGASKISDTSLKTRRQNHFLYWFSVLPGIQVFLSIHSCLSLAPLHCLSSVLSGSSCRCSSIIHPWMLVIFCFFMLVQHPTVGFPLLQICVCVVCCFLSNVVFSPCSLPCYRYRYQLFGHFIGIQSPAAEKKTNGWLGLHAPFHFSTHSCWKP